MENEKGKGHDQHLMSSGRQERLRVAADQHRMEYKVVPIENDRHIWCMMLDLGKSFAFHQASGPNDTRIV